MIKAVFFDAIDTLFQAYPNKIEMYRRIIKNHTRIETTTKEMTLVWNEILAEAEKAAEMEIDSQTPILAWDGFNAKILLKLGYAGEDFEQKGEELRLESWTNPENFRLYSDVIETLEKLREQNILIGCVSNEAEELNNFFTHFGIEKYFSCVTISEVEGCEKPNPKIFNIALEKLGLHPEEVIFVGDSLISDYEGSKQVGMLPVLIDRENEISDNTIVKISNLNNILDIIKEKQYEHSAA